MFINTDNILSIKNSICDVLNINDETLNKLIEICYDLFQKNKKVFFLDQQCDYFLNYVENRGFKNIDEVQFFHYSRRLNDQDNNGYGFKDVLIQDTSLSCFIKKYGITFEYDQYIKIYINKSKINLDNKDKSYSYEYLRQRFGYYFEDFAFKGFLFSDIDIKLFESYENGPEFLGYIFLFLDNDQIIDDFYKQSDFYKLKYLVPINEIYFEDFDELDDLAKQKHLIVQCLQRLYFDKYDPSMNIQDNVVVGA